MDRLQRDATASDENIASFVMLSFLMFSQKRFQEFSILDFSLLFLSFFLAGAAQVIHKSVQIITAGRNVTLHCQLAGIHDVVQITWQKEHEKTKTNVATYSKAHGSQVLGEYKNNVHLFQSGLQVSAITFHAATFQDEGCYNCIFNTFPLGSITGKTCLRVYALTDVKVNVRHIIDPHNTGSKALEINCSATGKPDPVVTWKDAKHVSAKPKEYVIQHPNETVTVVSSFTHVSSKDVYESPIICVVQHPSLTTAQELILPELGAEENPNIDQETIVKASICVLVSAFLLVLLVYSWKRLSSMHKKQGLPCWVHLSRSNSSGFASSCKSWKCNSWKTVLHSTEIPSDISSQRKPSRHMKDLLDHF
uniref:OX-2 membrane glycoprotein-like isoform X1 n=1 Tax=Pogona vitticeps TaxID=103695 RepID=A0ABM5FXB9_9SAUR